MFFAWIYIAGFFITWVGAMVYDLLDDSSLRGSDDLPDWDIEELTVYGFFALVAAIFWPFVALWLGAYFIARKIAKEMLIKIRVRSEELMK